MQNFRKKKKIGADPVFFSEIEDRFQVDLYSSDVLLNTLIENKSIRVEKELCDLRHEIVFKKKKKTRHFKYLVSSSLSLFVIFIFPELLLLFLFPQHAGVKCFFFLI